MQQLDQQEWRENLENDDNSVVLDVRTPEEVSQGYIPEAKVINIYNAQEFMEEVENLDRSKNYYIYCRSGSRSAQACMVLDKLGFNKTFNLAGGILKYEGELSSE